MDGLGLLIDDTLDATLTAVPVAFAAPPADVPPRWVPPLVVESQQQTSSCAGHAEALACSHANYVETGEVIRFSRWFAYITAQKIGGFFGRDGGTSITSTLQAATTNGCCLEATLPFPGRYDTAISAKAYDEASRHKHHGEMRFDLRDFEALMAWITDRRCCIIGTRWYDWQSQCAGIESKKIGTSGQFRGYHARLISGWDTHDGELVPVVQNSHGSNWGKHGRAMILRELWDTWRCDANFFALGFNEIDEVEPARRDWSESKPGDCV